MIQIRDRGKQQSDYRNLIVELKKLSQIVHGKVDMRAVYFH